MEKKSHHIKEGEYALCWYFKIPNDYSEGLDLYYCKVLKLGEEHSTCEIYHGNTFNPHIIRGTFTNVCTADIMQFDGSPVPPKTKKNTINFSKEVKANLKRSDKKLYSEIDMMTAFRAGKESPRTFDTWFNKYKKSNQ